MDAQPASALHAGGSMSDGRHPAVPTRQNDGTSRLVPRQPRSGNILMGNSVAASDGPAGVSCTARARTVGIGPVHRHAFSDHDGRSIPRTVRPRRGTPDARGQHPDRMARAEPEGPQAVRIGGSESLGEPRFGWHDRWHPLRSRWHVQRPHRFLRDTRKLAGDHPIWAVFWPGERSSPGGNPADLTLGVSSQKRKRAQLSCCRSTAWRP